MNGACLAPNVLFDFYTNRQLELECTVLLSSSETPVSMSLLTYVSTFAWTCGLEALVYLPLLLARKNKLTRALALILILNLATHPLVTFVFPMFGQGLGLNMASAIVLKETFAPLVETLILRRGSNLSWSEAAALAVAANLFSWWLGAYIVA